MPADTSADAKARQRKFTIDKFNWLRQVAGDRHLPPQALRLAVILAVDYINSENLEAWPSIETLKKKLDVEESAILRASGSMKKAGHLAVKKGNGPGQTSRYRWIIRNENAFENEGVSKEDHLHNRRGLEENPSDISQQTPSNSKKNPFEFAKETLSKTKDKHSESEPIDEPIEGNHSLAAVSTVLNGSGDSRSADAIASASSASGTILEGDILGPLDQQAAFDAIWSIWPKKTHRQKADAAFAKAVRMGVRVEDIARGAVAYIATRARYRNDPDKYERFTTNLSTWIEDRRWTDEHASSTAQQAIEANHDDDDDFDERYAARRAGFDF